MHHKKSNDHGAIIGQENIRPLPLANGNLLPRHFHLSHNYGRQSLNGVLLGRRD